MLNTLYSIYKCCKFVYNKFKMKFNFYKYQGTGNDFVILDNRTMSFPKNDTKLIEKICDRRFGIGADGLMLLENAEGFDFKMVYYNADGNESTMCGNGGRCLVAFAKQLNIIDKEANFIAVDGPHFATIDQESKVALQMIDVLKIDEYESYSFLNTGSPHHVELVSNIDNYPVKAQGAKIRYSDLYGKPGSNINFVEELTDNVFRLRTYERGVEDETLSCGTGATAAAIAMYNKGKATQPLIKLLVQGGALEVHFTKDNSIYKNVFLIGPAQFVFKGELDITTFN